MTEASKENSNSKSAQTKDLSEHAGKYKKQFCSGSRDYKKK